MESVIGRSENRSNKNAAWRDLQPTRKSLLRGAKLRDPKALAALCEVYWRPVYGLIRAHGVDEDLARDVTQEIFDNLLRRDLRTLDLERGSPFRSWLKCVARRHLFGVLKKKRRKAKLEIQGVELETTEDAALHSPDCALQDRLFDRCAALVLIDRAWERVRERFTDRPVLFEHVRQSLSGLDTLMTDAELSAHLGQCDCYARSIRKRVKDVEFPEALRTELRNLGVSKRRLNDELRALLGALS